MINYNTLISWNPTLLHSMANKHGQSIDFYECPIDGGDSPIIAACAALKMAGYTSFYDCDDMFEGSDYLPVFIQSAMLCEFEAPEHIDNAYSGCELTARTGATPDDTYRRVIRAAGAYGRILEVITREHSNDHHEGVVTVEKSAGFQKFVNWQYRTRGDSCALFWGHYFTSKKDALNDAADRARVLLDNGAHS